MNTFPIYAIQWSYNTTIYNDVYFKKKDNEAYLKNVSFRGAPLSWAPEARALVPQPKPGHDDR